VWCLHKSCQTNTIKYKLDDIVKIDIHIRLTRATWQTMMVLKIYECIAGVHFEAALVIGK